MHGLTRDTAGRLIWLSLFIVAMAQLEATVVVYLRELYYPDGFHFPLVIISGRIAWIEIGREAATVVMLVGIAKLFSRGDSWRQFAAFLWGFGLWDIFYYLWLWVMLRWPGSVLDTDVLFLIPLPWVGPVLAPVLISAVMMLAAWATLGLRDRGRTPRVSTLEWGVTIAAALALIGLFVSDAGSVLEGHLPRPFRWWLFYLLLLPACVAALTAYRRSVGPQA